MLFGTFFFFLHVLVLNNRVLVVTEQILTVRNLVKSRGGGGVAIRIVVSWGSTVLDSMSHTAVFHIH